MIGNRLSKFLMIKSIICTYRVVLGTSSWTMIPLPRCQFLSHNKGMYGTVKIFFSRCEFVVKRPSSSEQRPATTPNGSEKYFNSCERGARNHSRVPRYAHISHRHILIGHLGGWTAAAEERLVESSPTNDETVTVRLAPVWRDSDAGNTQVRVWARSQHYTIQTAVKIYTLLNLYLCWNHSIILYAGTGRRNISR